MQLSPIAVGLLALLSSPALPLAQDPPAEAADAPLERLKAWPTLRQRARVEKDIARLRAAQTTNMAKEARAALVADGAMVMPLLLKAFEGERDEEGQERVRDVLDALVEPTHTRLLQPWTQSEKLHVRIWAQRRVAVGLDPGLAREAAKLWKAIQRRLESRRPPDPEEVYSTSLLLVSTGDLTALPQLFERARDDWKRSRGELRTVLAGVRGGEAEAWLLERLAEGDRRTKSASLRLLAVAGTQVTLRHLGVHLDSSDNTLRVDAINACRGIVDGDPPLEKLAVFEAIGLAVEWQERIR